MANALFISLPMPVQVVLEVEILANDFGVKGVAIKVAGLVDEAIGAYGFKFEQNVVCVQKNEVNTAEASPCQLRQDIQALPAQRLAAWHDGQVWCFMYSLS
jgi:hypothetical protein